jgi:hypothetical protein
VVRGSNTILRQIPAGTLAARRENMVRIATSLPLVLAIVFASARAKAEPEVDGFFEGGLGLRTLSPDGVTLEGRAAGVPDSGSPVLRGADFTTPAYGGTTFVGGGLRVARLHLGVQTEAAMGAGAGGPTVSSRDGPVKPSGFAGIASAATFVGYAFDVRGTRGRVDVVLGVEIFGVGLQPIAPNGAVPGPANGERWTLGPRVRFDLFSVEGITGGIAFSFDAKNARNVGAAFVIGL